MDPDQCLKELRELIEKMNSGDARADLEYAGGIGQELADKADDLDEWLKKGGFLPQEWAAQRPGESRKERRNTLNANTLEMIREVLWPGGDADHEWSSDELDDISRLMHNAGLGPEG